jgi:hypothetical protein
MTIRDVIQEASAQLKRTHGYGIAIKKQLGEKDGNHTFLLAVGKNGVATWQEIITPQTEFKAFLEPEVKVPVFEYETITMAPWLIEVQISEFIVYHDPVVLLHIADEIWSRLQWQKEDTRLRAIASDFNTPLYAHARRYLMSLYEAGSIEYQWFDFELASYDTTNRTQRPDRTQIEFKRDHAAIMTLVKNRLAFVDTAVFHKVVIMRDGVRIAEILNE